MKLLDLFCCAGGASMGYSQAGFEVTGVDVKDQPSYPFKFIKGDVLEVLKDKNISPTQHCGCQFENIGNR